MVAYIKNQINWRRMKKIAFDHPYFDIKKHRLSEQAAEEILKQGYKSGREVLRNAYFECGVQLPEFLRDIDNIKSVKRSNVLNFRLRNVVVSLVILLIITAFFTLTKPGIALAENIYSVIIRIFSGTLFSQSDGIVDEQKSIDFESLLNEFESLEQLSLILKRPIVVMDDARIQLVRFRTDILEPDMVIINSKYKQSDKSFVLIQTIYNNQTMWGGAVSIASENKESVSLDSGLVLYIGQMEDGSVFADAYENGFDISVSSTEISIAQMREIVKSIRFIK